MAIAMPKMYQRLTLIHPLGGNRPLWIFQLPVLNYLVVLELLAICSTTFVK